MKNKKWIVLLLTALLLLGCLAGCGTESTTDSAAATPRPEPKTAEQITDPDAMFIGDLGAALEDRWQLEADNPIGNYASQSEEQKNTFLSYINAEYNYLEPYRNLTFKDTELGQKALSYLGTLDAQKAALDLLQTDPYGFGYGWQDASEQKAALLQDFISNYGLTVGEAYASQLAAVMPGTDETVAEEPAAVETEQVQTTEEETSGTGTGTDEQVVETKQLLDQWASQIVFIKQEDGSYAADVTNTTGRNLSVVDFKIELLNESGESLGVTYAEATNLKMGEMQQIRFNTPAEFTTTKTSVTFYLQG